MSEEMLGPGGRVQHDGSLLEATRRALAHRIARSQADCRLPSVAAGVVREGRLVWSCGIGDVDGAPPTSDTQYRIGSITKTFAAAQVMRLRDEGLVDLDDPVGRHVHGTPVGDRTVRQLLAHTAGLQAETAGPWWERAPGSPWGDFRAELTDDMVIGGPGHRFHYSNVGFAVLGAIIERHRGQDWSTALQHEILEPLGMARTTTRPEPPHARGWAVHPWADVLLTEPEHDAGAMAPAGQLWSTVEDLARWVAFMTGDTGGVLAADTLEEMCEPIVVHDEEWATGHGLGVQVFRRGDRRFVGHGGSMPGFLAYVVADRAQHTGVVVVTNTTSGLDLVAPDLLTLVLDAEPRLPDVWRPADDLPPGVMDLLGPWYWGPAAYAVRWRDGHLHLGPLGPRGRASRFRPADDGTFVGLDGYYRGETLRPVRRPDGTLSHLDLATFIFTREPYDPEAPIPGGVDPDGWRPA